MRLTVTPASDTDSDRPDAIAFEWMDLAGEEDSFLFVAEGASKEDIDNFEMTVYSCMWERANNKDSKDVKAADIMKYRCVRTHLSSAA